MPGRPLVVFGRVPLFYYVVHILVVQVSSRVFYRLVYGEDFSAIRDGMGGRFPPWYGHPLWVVYLSRFLVVAALYPACVWYAGVKQRSRSPVFTYL